MEILHREETLLEQDALIQILVSSYGKMEVRSIGRKIGIDPTEYYSDSISMAELADRFVSRTFELNKESELKKALEAARSYMGMSTNNRSATSFIKLLTIFFDKLDSVDEKEFSESNLFEPIEFEEKMRNKAKLNEDIVKAGIRIKPDVSVLRRKAYAMDYKKYDILLTKLARHYIYEICEKYPLEKYNSDTRFVQFYNQLINLIPEDMFDKDENIEQKVEGIIYDAISRCLIFNE